MDRLTNYANNLLSEGIENLVSSLKGNRIQRTLLDGTIHVQTVGNSRKEIKFNVYTKMPEAELINSYHFLGTQVKVYYDNVVYIGTVIAEPAWTETVKGEIDERFLKSSLVVNVESEGII